MLHVFFKCEKADPLWNLLELSVAFTRLLGRELTAYEFMQGNNIVLLLIYTSEQFYSARLDNPSFITTLILGFNYENINNNN